MNRKIRTYGGYFEAFMAELEEKVQEKIQYGLLLLKIQDRISSKFVKFIRDGIFELRTKQSSNITRILYFFVVGHQIILTNGFVKKTQKTPPEEIALAQKYRADYFYRKESSS